MAASLSSSLSSQFTVFFSPSPSSSLQPPSLSFRTRRTNPNPSLCPRALTLDFSGSFFERGSEDEREGGGGGGGDGGPTAAAAAALQEKEEPQCPPGLRQYETMAVLRPDMTEDERLALTQRYEEVSNVLVCFILKKIHLFVLKLVS